MSRPVWARRERPRALMTPAVTVVWKPKGLPMAMASWPGLQARGLAELRLDKPGSVDADDREVGVRIVADESGGIFPAIDEGDRMAEAPWTTWELVRMKPSRLRMKPGAGAAGLAGAAPVNDLLADLDIDDATGWLFRRRR